MSEFNDDDVRTIRERHSHIFSRNDLDHYAEPRWCSQRLFEVETFQGSVYDPCCGFGTIVISALEHGLHAAGSDIVNRGWDSTLTPSDFLKWDIVYDNIVLNPPFAKISEFIVHAVRHSRRKTAVIFPVARLPAAAWLKQLPLQRVWLLTPRPSMPPGSYIKAGHKPAGGRVDFCWLVFNHEHTGLPQMCWLHRDGGSRAIP
jgi:hypothetical protein